MLTICKILASHASKLKYQIKASETLNNNFTFKICYVVSFKDNIYFTNLNANGRFFKTISNAWNASPGGVLDDPDFKYSSILFICIILTIEVEILKIIVLLFSSFTTDTVSDF